LFARGFRRLLVAGATLVYPTERDSKAPPPPQPPGKWVWVVCEPLILKVAS
jgi:hypothetical protein